LRRCGDELTRARLLGVATHLQGIHLPALLPGITVNISPRDHNPFKQMRLQRFDEKRGVLLPDMFDE
jgi:branched-chain amino acid transport system substrate-binding protein